MYKRPALYTNYQSETSILPTWTQRVAAGVLVVLAVLLPFSLPVINQLPFVRYLGDPDWLRIVTQAVIFAIAALGLNLLTGVAGQVSLGHSFFMGVGAYTAAVIGGEEGGRTWGLGLPIWIWLPAAGIGAAAVGLLIGPAAVRVRGLYLGIVTIGLVFIGIHLSRVFPEISGPAEIGRDFPPLQFSGGRSPTGHLVRRRRPLAVVRHLRRGEVLPVHARHARSRHRRRQEPRAHANRTGPAGDPRPRRRRRDHGRTGGPLQADRLRHLVVLRRYRRGRCSPRSSAACHPSTGA